MKVYVGADWSAKAIDCAAAGEEGKPRAIKGPIPTQTSVSDFLERVRKFIGGDSVHVMLEAGSVLWARLFHAAGALVFVVDPKQSKKFVESQCSSGAKDDRRDARSLANMLRSPAHRPEPWAPDTEVMEQVDMLVATHEQVTSNLGRSKQRLRSTVAGYMPLVAEALPKELRARWVDGFLREVSTPWHAQGLTRERLDELTNGTGMRRSTKDKLWKALEQSRATWMSEKVAHTIARRVRMLLDEIALSGRQLDELEAEMDELTRGLPTRERVESMPGIGMKQAITLIQHAFRDGAPADRDTASICMGASPVFVGSGRRRDGSRKGHVLMRKAAPSRARRATFLMGRLASQNLPWAKAMYADAMSRGQKSATAYRRIARSVLRIHTRMARTGEPYDDARYVAALKSKGVSWAAAL